EKRCVRVGRIAGARPDARLAGFDPAATFEFSRANCVSLAALWHPCMIENASILISVEPGTLHLLGGGGGR
ncbi:MAG: hypothetical protein MUP61_01530, partial [Burkholderiales bacterium]|nr:hypothetical protein [Burkholderiales bacterium]